MALRFEKIIEMRKERKKLWEEARTYRDEKEKSHDDGKLTAEERSAYDQRLSDVEALTQKIEDAERELAIEERMLEDDAKRKDVERTKGDKDERSVQYRAAFDAYLRHGFSGLDAEQRSLMQEARTEARAMGVAPDSAGGYTVPNEMMSVIIDGQKAFNGVRRSRAEIMPSSDGRPWDMPTGDDTGVEGEQIGENQPATEGDITLGTKPFPVYKYSTRIIRVSMELLQDSNTNIENYISRKMMERIGRVTERKFTVGTGTAEPEGIVTASALGHTAAAATAITYDDIIDLTDSVDEAYSVNAELMFSKRVLTALKKLKDADGRPLWVPGVAMREPDRLAGYPYVVNMHMADIAASAVTMLFGDMSYFKVRDVAGGVMLRLTERYAEFNQVAFLGFFRHGSALPDPGTNPIKHMVQAAV